ncbi:ABC transporter ATP-binding protein [Thermocrinis ruber]|uniref:ABC transporter ATP-binding protein n=1 Tax=Thermocrinis ruber TaxID=75906 RepID=W0DC23_9AQUI|nr:ABC transporter ATP-binding protein [Thermocrinis ruber]AHE95801.1 ABC transporter ATP-binding protein [Thermocrinis ruber]
MKPLIRLSGIKKTVGSEQILKGIDLEIYEGEFVSIIGASGSGKSSLLYIMGLLDKPTKGEVFFEGEKIDYSNDKRLSYLRNSKIGFVFQFHYLVQELSLLDNVILPAIKKGVPIKEAREMAMVLLERLGLKGKENRKPYEISGGEMQRTAIARALINQPKVLLADEPTGNLDSTNTQRVMDIFKEINKSQTTIVMVTHEIDLARQTKRIVELRDGSVIRQEYLQPFSPGPGT